jgi:hypothetical protein
MYLLSIASARSHLRIAAAYFVPDDLSMETLIAARRRGVRVEVILPGTKSDTEITRKASRSRWGDLLRAGVLIHEYQPTMFHCKVMIVDDVWVSVGSTNFDSRSFRLNDEPRVDGKGHGARCRAAAFSAALARDNPWRENRVVLRVVPSQSFVEATGIPPGRPHLPAPAERSRSPRKCCVTQGPEAPARCARAAGTSLAVDRAITARWRCAIRATWNDTGEGVMLWTIAVILAVLWLLGMVSSTTMGGFIHILLVLAVAVILINVIQGRRIA